VCNIHKPETNLKAKFSDRWLAGLVLDGRPTGSIDLCIDSLRQVQSLIAFANCAEVIPDPNVEHMQYECELVLISGHVISTRFVLERPISTIASMQEAQATLP